MQRMMVTATLAIALCAPGIVDACTPVAVCQDVIASLWGDVLSEDIAIGWDVELEPDGVWYRVHRYTSDPDDRQIVATIGGAGACLDPAPYSVTDGDGEAGDVYTVEVWTAGNFRQCAVDVAPD